MERSQDGVSIGVASKGANVDPTDAVRALVEANAKAAETVRQADNRYYDAVMKGLQELVTLRAAHAQELRNNDIERYAAIRQVDTTNSAGSSAQTQLAIQALAKSTEDIRKTLADQMANRDSRVDERLGSLERAGAIGAGKQAVSDPQMEKLTALVEALARNQAAGTGKSEGISAMWGVIVGVVGMIAAIVAIAVAIVADNKVQQQYVPPPSATAPAR